MTLNQCLETLKQYIKIAPEQPGVYRMLGDDDVVFREIDMLSFAAGGGGEGKDDSDQYEQGEVFLYHGSLVFVVLVNSNGFSS